MSREPVLTREAADAADGIVNNILIPWLQADASMPQRSFPEWVQALGDVRAGIIAFIRAYGEGRA